MNSKRAGELATKILTCKKCHSVDGTKLAAAVLEMLAEVRAAEIAGFTAGLDLAANHVRNNGHKDASNEIMALPRTPPAAS